MSEQSTVDRAELAKTQEVLPPEGNERVGREVFKILDAVLKHKQDLGLPAKWHRCYELSRNKHWRNPSSKAPLVSANLLHSHRQRTVSALTDNNPTFNVNQVGQVEEEMEAVFHKLLKTAEFWWSDMEQQNVLELSVGNGELYGCTIEKVAFNPDLEYGQGEVETIVVDPMHFGFYPVKTQNLQKAQACLHFYPMSLRDARRIWPDQADKIIADRDWLDQLGDSRLEVQSNMTQQSKGYFSSIAGVIKNMVTNADDESRDIEEVLVVEAWVKDYTRVKGQEELLDNEGRVIDTVEYEEDLYPGNIRCVTSCNGGNVVLDDRPNPSINWDIIPLDQAMKTYLFDKFPFSLTVSINDTTNPWGMTDFEQLEGLNIEVNKTISQMTLVKDRVSRVKIINPKDSGVANSEFTNKPGVINPRSQLVAQGIRYMDPPKFPMDLEKALQVYQDFFTMVSGAFELESAKSPGRDVIAYKAIAALLERAATMMRTKIRNYGRMIRIRGRMFLGCMQNWYTEERYISYQVDGEDVTDAIQGNMMIVPAKLSVISGSTMPVSKVQEREEAIELFKLGAIDAEELLKKLEWEDWKDVAARLKMGPVGEFIQKLVMMGLPEDAAQALSEIGQMDMKEFEKTLEKGEIPMIQHMIGEAPQQLTPDQIPPSPVEQAEIRDKEARVQKTLVEIELIQAQIMTEQVDQQVKLAGVQLDKDKLAIERAKTVKEIETADAMAAADRTVPDGSGTSARAKSKTQGPYREKGMKSNNKKV
jgi:hypothetical protein